MMTGYNFNTKCIMGGFNTKCIMGFLSVFFCLCFLATLKIGNPPAVILQINNDTSSIGKIHNTTITAELSGSDDILLTNFYRSRCFSDAPSACWVGRSRLWRDYKSGILNCITGKVYMSRSDRGQAKVNGRSRPSTAGTTSYRPETSEERRASFRNIFLKKIWGGQKNETGHMRGSGPGSTVKATRVTRMLLGTVLDQVKVILGVTRIRMLDIPCGDMTWMTHFLSARADVDYTGMDIVPEIIETHQKFFSQKKNMKFILSDVVNEKLNHSYDLIFSREMIQHLSNSDTMSVLSNFEQSGSAFLLVTSAPRLNSNSELDRSVTWRHRMQNLLLSPYNRNKPICYRTEQNARHGMMLYKLPFE